MRTVRLVKSGDLRASTSLHMEGYGISRPPRGRSDCAGAWDRCGRRCGSRLCSDHNAELMEARHLWVQPVRLTSHQLVAQLGAKPQAARIGGSNRPTILGTPAGLIGRAVMMRLVGSGGLPAFTNTHMKGMRISTATKRPWRLRGSSGG